MRPKTKVMDGFKRPSKSEEQDIMHMKNEGGVGGTTI